MFQSLKSFTQLDMTYAVKSVDIDLGDFSYAA